MRKGIAMLVGD